MKNKCVMRRGYMWIAALLSVILMIPAISVSAASSVNITTATDGRNTLALSESSISGVTFVDSVITVAGTASPAGSEVAIIAYLAGSDKDDDVVYMEQVTSNATTGAYTFDFGFENIAAGVYRIDVGVQGSSTEQTRYFQVMETLPPEGGKDVFAHLSVGGQAVSFDSDLVTKVNVGTKTVPVIDAIAADNNIKLATTAPAAVPGKAVITATLADGTVKKYAVIINFKPNNTAVNLKYKNSESGAYNNGGADKNYLNYNLGAITNTDTPYKILFEEGIKFGTSTSDATLAYCDRTNVYYTGGSDVLKDAVILRPRKDDGGTTLVKGEFFTNTYNGVGNNPAWISFDVNADATVYVFDRYGEIYTQAEWPALVNLGFSRNPGLYIKGTATGASGDYVYYKKFKAGETVKIPSYGRPGKWAGSEYDATTPYDPPVYAIIWDGKAEDYTEPSVTKGDVNQDGKVNALDRAFVARHLAKWENNQTLPSEEAADINGDGRVNALDRAFISRYLAKWEGYDL